MSTKLYVRRVNSFDGQDLILHQQHCMEKEIRMKKLTMEGRNKLRDVRKSVKPACPLNAY
jgi:hypothetical protein